MLLDGMKEEFSAVIDELIPDLMTLGEVQKFFRIYCVKEYRLGILLLS